MTHEYAFDVQLWAVCRVSAESEDEARLKMLNGLNCLDVGLVINNGVKVTEATMEDGASLFEIDGNELA